MVPRGTPALERLPWAELPAPVIREDAWERVVTLQGFPELGVVSGLSGWDFWGVEPTEPGVLGLVFPVIRESLVVPTKGALLFHETLTDYKTEQ